MSQSLSYRGKGPPATNWHQEMHQKHVTRKRDRGKQLWIDKLDKAMVGISSNYYMPSIEYGIYCTIEVQGQARVQ